MMMMNVRVIGVWLSPNQTNEAREKRTATNICQEITARLNVWVGSVHVRRVEVFITRCAPDYSYLHGAALSYPDINAFMAGGEN